jgi:hypothetical protein
MAVPLPSLTRQLNAAAQDPAFDGERLRLLLQELHAPLLGKIEEDAAHPDRFAAWGRSSNRENDPDIELVHPRLLTALCGLMGQAQPDREAVNAGLLHTYGYLLSNRRTPYGFKRERWTQKKLERGLGLRPGVLAPVPEERTLLANVTDLMHLIWKAEAGVHLFRDANPRLHAFTLLEEVEGSPIQLLTRVVKLFPPILGGAVFHAWTDQHSLRYVTLFPVDEAKLKDLTQRHSPGRGLVKPRYNAVIPDLDPLGRPGRIVVEDWQDLPGVPPILR